MPTKRFFTFATLTTLATLTLVLTGMRCTKTTTPEPAPKTTIPVYTQKRVLGRVDWPSSSTINQAALAMIRPEERAKVALSATPVLVPNNPSFLASGIMMRPDESGYDFGSADHIDGIDFTLGGNRASTQSNAPVPEYMYDKNRPDDRVVAGNRKVAVSRISGDGDAGPWMATWVEYGEVAYDVILICVDPNDSKCADDTYLRSFIASLVYVGGAGK